MNKIISLGENDFRKTISKMKVSEIESLMRLLVREILQEKEQLGRSREFRKLSQNQENASGCLKYEKLIKENDLLIETLEKRLFNCQKEIDSKNVEIKSSRVVTSNHFVPSITSKTNPVSQKQSVDLNSSNNGDSSTPIISTKSLINNFESINISATSSLNRPKKDTTDNSIKKKDVSQISTPARKSSKYEEKVDSPILFTSVKLKKVGLPPDAKENENTSIIIEKTVIQTIPDNQSRKSSLSNGTLLLPKSISIDFGNSSPLSAKDKFYNPNKDIQVAIQNELKEVKLKKTNHGISSSGVNCPVENISLGKYNFVNEKILTNSTSTSAGMSTCKSMPFLNSITTENNTLSETKFEDISSPSFSRENVETNENISNISELSTIQNWDPTIVLQQLYDVDKQLNEVQYPSRNNVKNISGYIEMMPGSSYNTSNSNLWRRRFATISNREIKIFDNQSSKSEIISFDVKNIFTQKVNEEILELCDSRGVHSTIKFPKSTDCIQWTDALKTHLSYKSSEIIPRIYDSINSNNIPKILIMDIGSCSIRAGLLKTEPTLPKIYFPNIAAISKLTNDVVEVGFEAVNMILREDCNLIRPLKPDTTLEYIAFTSGTVEFILRKVCTSFNINPEEYVIMLSLPHNVAEVTRTRLADVLIFRMNFKGVSMCGQSLLALHAYGEPTGVLVDIGHRTEVLPVIHGIVQNASIMRSLHGGHLIQIALGHLLPFQLNSLTDFLLARYIMEKSCLVAENSSAANNFNETSNINLEKFNLPHSFPKSLSIPGKDRCLPVEGLFNSEIYSLDVPSLPKLIFKSIQSCPVDNRRDLYQSICLSGAGTQFNGLSDRLEMELKQLVPKNCEVKIHSSPNRAHFSYVGACFVALSDSFNNTVVNRREWEESRNVALKKWHL